MQMRNEGTQEIKRVNRSQLTDHGRESRVNFRQDRLQAKELWQE